MSYTYKIEYAKTGRSSCKDTKCKSKSIASGALRISKSNPAPEAFGGSDREMVKWFHPKCLFNAQSRMRAGSKKVTSTDDLEGFDDIKAADKKKVEALIKGEGGDDDDEEGGDDDGEDEKKSKKKKAAPKRKKTPSKKKKEADDDDGDDDGGDDDEEEAPKKKKAKKEKKEEKEEKKTKKKAEKKSPAKKKSKKKDDDDADGEDDDGDDDGDSKKKTKKKAGGGGGGGKARMFEHETKFWEITRLSDTSFQTRYGKLGSDGRTDTKDWPSSDKCDKEFEKLIRQKTNKGYEEK